MTAIPSELLEYYRSLFFYDGKYSALDVCRWLLEHRDKVEPEWIDVFFADCMFPLEISYDVWRNADDRRRLRELLELEETLLGSVSEEQLSGKEAIENYDSSSGYRQRLNIFFAASCFYGKDTESFRVYANRMLEDSEANILAYFVQLEETGKAMHLLPDWMNPLMYFSRQVLFDSPCLYVLKTVLEQYEGFLSTLSFSCATAVEKGALLIEEAERRIVIMEEKLMEEVELWEN